MGEAPVALQRAKPVLTMPSISVEVPGSHYLSPNGLTMRNVAMRGKDWNIFRESGTDHCP